MPFFILSINHHSAPIAIREQVAFSPPEIKNALDELTHLESVQEAAIISTCNRTEIYAVLEQPEVLIDWLCRYHKIEYEQLQPYLHSYSSTDGIRHVFRVASGLESMVLGEPQILGQMKQAVQTATQSSTLGTLLNKLFQNAFSVAKKVRSNTSIGHNIVSMAAAGTHLAERIFPSIRGQHTLFIGAGEMVSLCLAHFSAKTPSSITIANRTLEKGNELANRFNAKAIRLDDIPSQMHQFDIVVSCTAASLPIIGLGLMDRAIKARRHKPVFILDLAVPRDIEPEVADLDDIFLYTTDDLSQIVAIGQESRLAAANDASQIVEQSVNEFEHWLKARQNTPLLRALHDATERMRRHELEHALKQISKGESAQNVLESLSKRLTKKFLHAPSLTLNNIAEHERETLLEAARKLFHLHK